MTRRRPATSVRQAAIPLIVAAVTAGLVAIVGNAGAITGASVSPTTLSVSAQEFMITYSGKDVGTPTNPTPNLIVEECIANDSKPGFDPDVDCSVLSLQNFSQTPASGTITYGGNPGNPTAPFVGLDPNNGEWSICDPSAAGPTVINYQTGFFRVADSVGDQVDDFFIPITCAGSPPATTTTTTAPPATTTTTTPGATTTTTLVGGSTTTTTPDGTTTTTLGDGATTTTTTPGSTTTTTPIGGTTGTADDPGGSSGGFGGGSAGELARTGSNPIELVKLALVLLYTGWLLRRSGRDHRPKGMT